MADDAYSRVTQESYPDGGWTQHTYKDDYFNGKLRSYVRTRRRVTDSLYDQRYDSFDGLGRLLRTTRTTHAGGGRHPVDRGPTPISS